MKCKISRTLLFKSHFVSFSHSSSALLLMISIDIFHDDHPINVVLLFMSSAEISLLRTKSPSPQERQKGKNLNPLSSEFDTIITKDFHSLAEATSACRIRLHKCDVMERWASSLKAHTDARMDSTLITLGWFWNQQNSCGQLTLIQSKAIIPRDRQ